MWKALNEYLARRGLGPGARAVGPRRAIPEDEWQDDIRAAIDRMRAGVPPDVSPEEIEAEITAAREEVRRERAARRQAMRA